MLMVLELLIVRLYHHGLRRGLICPLFQSVLAKVAHRELGRLRKCLRLVDAVYQRL